MAQAEIKEYRPNTLQKLRDWYERIAPRNPGQRTLFDISTGPVSGLANLTTATEKNDKLTQILELMGNMPGGKIVGGVAAGAGIIKKADVDKLVAKVLSGEVPPDQAKKLTTMLNNPSDWKTNYWHDPKTKRNYFYGPDGVLREEVPDYVSEMDRLSSARHRFNMPSTYTPEEVRLFTDDVSGPYTVSKLNTGSTQAWPSTDRYSVKIPMNKKGIYRSKSSKWGELRGQELRDFIDRFGAINNKREAQHGMFQDSVLAHELTHVGQFREGLPTGGNTQESLAEMYKYLSPQDRARLKVGQDVFRNELTRDPLLAEIFAVRQPPEVRSQIQDLLYKNLKEEPIYETVPSIFGDKQVQKGVKQIIDAEGLQRDLFAAYKQGNLKGANLGPIEDFFKLNQKGFNKYKANIGEVDARMGQARLLKANFQNSADVYNTHPYSLLDVPAEDIWWKDPLGDTTK